MARSEGTGEALRRAGLLDYDELRGLGWEWQNMEGCMQERRWRGRRRGESPRIGEKNGDREMIEFACAVIVWKNPVSVHPGLIFG
ncbi:MAG: hypothetical protein LBG43_07160 [Treponema sp.]|nr:hypothetical protein [Treponema sp.]